MKYLHIYFYKSWNLYEFFKKYILWWCYQEKKVQCAILISSSSKDNYYIKGYHQNVCTFYIEQVIILENFVEIFWRISSVLPHLTLKWCEVSNFFKVILWSYCLNINKKMQYQLSNLAQTKNNSIKYKNKFLSVVGTCIKQITFRFCNFPIEFWNSPTCCLTCFL